MLLANVSKNLLLLTKFPFSSFIVFITLWKPNNIVLVIHTCLSSSTLGNDILSINEFTFCLILSTNVDNSDCAANACAIPFSIASLCASILKICDMDISLTELTKFLIFSCFNTILVAPVSKNVGILFPSFVVSCIVKESLLKKSFTTSNLFINNAWIFGWLIIALNLSL